MWFSYIQSLHFSNVEETTSIIFKPRKLIHDFRFTLFLFPDDLQQIMTPNLPQKMNEVNVLKLSPFPWYC